MIISAAKYEPQNPYPQNFKCIDVSTLDDVSRIIRTSIWSPICWRNNRRLSDEFFCSDFLVLDYDDGRISLNDALEWAKNYNHIIGTTKSHQKEKSNAPACDRFRVVIPWETRIDDLKTYRQNMERILPIMQSDPACKDGARIYQPCINIVSIGDGAKAKWFPYEAPKPRPVNAYYTETKTIPLWLQDFMTTPPGEGMRNKTAYKIAYYLARYGFSESECLSAVLSAPIDLPESEKRACAKSGYRYGMKNP